MPVVHMHAGVVSSPIFKMWAGECTALWTLSLVYVPLKTVCDTPNVKCYLSYLSGQEPACGYWQYPVPWRCLRLSFALQAQIDIVQSLWFLYWKEQLPGAMVLVCLFSLHRFAIMARCWALSPEDRPGFGFLVHGLYTYADSLKCYI